LKFDFEKLNFEIEFSVKYFLGSFLKVDDEKLKQELVDGFRPICEWLASHKMVLTHRDFHSRNIMLTNQQDIAIIDYQDAMSGAVTYDLVSLLKDCYIEFEEGEINKLALYFRDKKGLDIGDEEFIKWFDFMGMQRHIKVLGVFARLYKRDDKRGYLKDIPLVLKYVFDTSKLYEETRPLNKLLKEI